MRPHKLIEALTDKCKPDTAIKDALGAIDRWGAASLPCFDFGNVANIDNNVFHDLIMYGVELVHNDLFNLPFQRVVYSFRFEMPSNGKSFNMTMFMDQAKIGVKITVIALEGSDSFIGMGTLAIIFEESKKNGPTKLSFTKGSVVVGSRVIEGSDMIVKKLGGEFSASWCVVLSAMLNASSIEKKLSPAPERLNKRRAALGRPPIGDVYDVLINVGGKRYLPSGEAEKGSHASPRLHWRRGHIRRLPSGEITHVRPHLVGASAGGAVPAKKDYRVKAGPLDRRK